MTAPATLTVDLNAVSHNYRALEALTGRPVHPVVKADSYGLGAVQVSTRLMHEGARTFFVARASEGVALRKALGPQPVIYVLDGCIGDTAPILKAADLRPVLNHPEQITAWTSAGGGTCGLQIDTGMNRLGFRPEDEGLRDQADAALSRGWDRIQAILEAAGVPLIDLPPPTESLGGRG